MVDGCSHGRLGSCGMCFLDALNGPSNSPAFQSLCVATTTNPSYSSAHKISATTTLQPKGGRKLARLSPPLSLSLYLSPVPSQTSSASLTLSRNCVCQFFSISCSGVLLVSNQAKGKFCDKPPTFLRLWRRVGRPPAQVKLH